MIDLQSLLRSGAFAWLAGGGFTVGLDDRREGAPGFYDVAVPRPTPLTHAVDWYLQTLAPLGVPAQRAFTWLPERPAVAAAVREKWNLGTGRWIALQPGARWENKRWPVEYFAETARRIARERDDVRFAILGGAGERELGEAIARAVPDRSLNLAGGLSLLEMIEWLRLCDVMISNDTGPMHVAAALGRPVVALFGPTEPRRTGPYGQLDRVLQFRPACAPCMKSVCRWPHPLECLHRTTPETVTRNAVEILARLKPHG